MIWDILVFLAAGAIAGWIVCKITNVRGTLLFDVIIGIVGAIAGNLLGKVLHIYTDFLKLNVGSILSAVVGALVLAFVFNLLTKKH